MAHRTQVFFMLADGSIRHYAQPLYASLARGEIAVSEYASQCLRVADWYVLYDGEAAVSIDNETYLIVWFDETGHARPHCDPSCAPRSWSFWAPTPQERERLSNIIFGRPGATTDGT